MVGITTVLVSAFAAYGVSKSMNTSNTKLSELALANIEALAQDEGSFMFNGQYWDNEHHWYNHIGTDYSPDLRECTGHSGSWGVNFDIKPEGIGVGGSYQSGGESYQGQKIVCKRGDANCFNGTDCLEAY